MSQFDGTIAITKKAAMRIEDEKKADWKHIRSRLAYHIGKVRHAGNRLAALHLQNNESSELMELDRLHKENNALKEKLELEAVNRNNFQVDELIKNGNTVVSLKEWVSDVEIPDLLKLVVEIRENNAQLKKESLTLKDDKNKIEIYESKSEILKKRLKTMKETKISLELDRMKLRENSKTRLDEKSKELEAVENRIRDLAFVKGLAELKLDKIHEIKKRAFEQLRQLLVDEGRKRIELNDKLAKCIEMDKQMSPSRRSVKRKAEDNDLPSKKMKEIICSKSIVRCASEPQIGCTKTSKTIYSASSFTSLDM